MAYLAIKALGRITRETGLWLARGTFRDPVSVRVLGRGNVQGRKVANGRRGPRVSPFVDFAVAVYKRNPASPGMIAAREINHIPLRWLIGPAVHRGTPLAIIDAIASLVEKHDGHRRSRV